MKFIGKSANMAFVLLQEIGGGGGGAARRIFAEKSRGNEKSTVESSK